MVGGGEGGGGGKRGRSRRRGKRRANKTRNRAATDVEDLTLQDSANADRPDTRLSKARIRNNLCQAQEEVEKLEEEIAKEKLEEQEQEEEEESEEAFANSNRNRRKKKKKLSAVMKCGDDDDVGVVYPYDLFELISDALLPESVAAFSCVCRSAYAAVSRARFWRKLHRDLYREANKDEDAIPQDLRPWNIARNGVELK